MKPKLFHAQFRLLIVCVCFSLLFATAPLQLRAQQNASGSISGTVLDPDGNAVQNAVVAVRSESSAAVTKAVTDQQGKFSVPGLPPGSYTVEVSVPGFALAIRTGVRAGGEQTAELSISLVLGSVSDAITVEANASGSLAAQHAPMDGLLEARSARTEVTPVFIQNFVSPVADFGELIEMAPGTFSISSNGKLNWGRTRRIFAVFPTAITISISTAFLSTTRTRPPITPGLSSRSLGSAAWTLTAARDRLPPSDRRLSAGPFTCSRRRWAPLPRFSEAFLTVRSTPS